MKYLDQIDLYKKLIPRHQSFLVSYMNDPSRVGYKAAEKAGYKSKNLMVTASKILKDPRIKEIIEKYNELISSDYSELREKNIKELCLIAFADMSEFVKWKNENFHFLKTEDMKEGFSRIIHELSISNGKPKIKLYNKIEAIKELNKMLGHYSAEKHEHSNPDGKMGQTTVVLLPSNGREKK